MNRRELLKTMGAAGLAAAIPFAKSSAAEQSLPKPAPSSMPMGAGYYKHKVGEFTLYLITDGTIQLTPDRFGGEGVAQDAVKQLLSSTHYPIDKIDTHIHTLLIQAREKLILVDTGCGISPGARSGQLLINLANAGFEPSQITDVVLTHAHPDHLFGCIGHGGNLVFPNAMHHLSKLEWDQWYRSEKALESMPEGGMKGMLTGINRQFAGIEPLTNFLEEGESIFPGISTIPLPGHTLGHIGLDIRSKGERHLYLSDIAHHSELFFQHPEWHFGFDTDPLQAVKTRKQIFEEVSNEGVSVSASHMPFPGFGNILKQGNAFRWLPGFWQWS